MAAQQTTPPLENDSNVRKRVCKACDRCRLKKSKCDGVHPCGRCKADDTICAFGERKKSQDKVYPKGYVEMLESQQAILVNGLQELYKRSTNGQGWAGPLLSDSSITGNPHIHEILDRLGVLQLDSQGNCAIFEEDPEAMQQRLVNEGAGLIPRRPSLDSDCERDSRQASFFDQNSQRSSTTSHFSNSQLPTPPTQSPGITQSLNRPTRPWALPTHRATQVRPQSLQIQPGYTWEAGMNPAMLQDSNWVDSPAPFDTNMAYLPNNGYPEFSNVDSNVEMLDFNDDMFNSYLNTPAA
ncbi:hypothetical protein MMC30_007276 [Trapelia coarctata]|nr:hypothetical protein [Trapelia coarctata]